MSVFCVLSIVGNRTLRPTILKTTTSSNSTSVDTSFVFCVTARNQSLYRKLYIVLVITFDRYVGFLCFWYRQKIDFALYDFSNSNIPQLFTDQYQFWVLCSVKCLNRLFVLLTYLFFVNNKSKCKMEIFIHKRVDNTCTYL